MVKTGVSTTARAAEILAKSRVVISLRSLALAPAFGETKWHLTTLAGVCHKIVNDGRGSKTSTSYCPDTELAAAHPATVDLTAEKCARTGTD